MARFTFGTVVAALLLAAPAVASAQTRWKEIGKTVSGNRVYVDPRSMHAQKDLRDATVRVVFTTPVESPQGALYTSRTRATFNCTTRRLAVKENVFYGNAKESRIIERKVNKIPGFGWVPEGSMGAVALDYLCKSK